MLTEKKTTTAHILLIDDDSSALETMQLIFQTFEPGYDIKTINHAPQIIEYLNGTTPDLVITDWEMPAMDGLEVIKHIRSIPAMNNTPIIMATGIRTSGEHLMAALESGADDFLRKPFDKAELISRSRSMLQKSGYIREIQDQHAAIREYHQFLASLLASVPTPVVFYSPEGKIINCNHSFLDVFGLSSDAAVGQIIYSLCPNMQQMRKQTEEMLRNNQKQIRFESSFNFPQKENITFLINKTIYYNPPEKPAGIICVMSDITELKELHQQSMEGKKRELVSAAMRMIQMDETIEKLFADIEILQKNFGSDGQDMLRELAVKYNMKTLNSTWKEFEMRFESVYEEFYHRLDTLHPGLTNSERKLCALLRLNLTSKEIAALTFQDAKSVDMARYRLRKKLNLAQEDNLITYLIKI